MLFRRAEIASRRRADGGFPPSPTGNEAAIAVTKDDRASPIARKGSTAGCGVAIEGVTAIEEEGSAVG